MKDKTGIYLLVKSEITVVHYILIYYLALPSDLHIAFKLTHF